MSKMKDVKKLITEHLDIWLTAETEKKSGRGRSSSSANSIYGVQKLRELILDLAFQGKISRYENSDQKIEKNILKNKINLKKNKFHEEFYPKFKFSKVIEEPIDEPYALPEYWTWFRLPDVTCYKAGKTPSTKNSSYWTSDSKNKWMSISDLEHMSTIIHSDKYITDKAIEEVFKGEIVPENTLLMSFKLSIGKVSILETSAFHNEAIISIYPSEFIDQRYLMYLLPKFSNLGDFKNAIKGNTLNQDSIAQILVPLPLLEEQKRIVAKVDELMQLCDRLEDKQSLSSDAHDQLVDTLLNVLTNSSDADEFQQNWQRISENFDLLFTTEYSIEQLKQTILQLAVMGKLVKQDPNDESASELLKQIAEEKARLIKEGKIKKSKPLPEITDEEKPFELPVGWEWEKLGNICLIKGGKRVPNGYQLLTEPTPYIYIRVSDMKDGTIDDSNLRFLDQNIQESIKKYIITKNDLYMTIVGATIGKCGSVPERFDGMNLTENAARLIPLEGINKKFLLKVLESDFCQNQFIDKTQQVGVQKMALNRLSETFIPICNIRQQKETIKKIDELFFIIENFQKLRSKLQKIKLHLADSLVTNVLSFANNQHELQVVAENIIQFEKPIEAVKYSKQKSADQIDLFTDERVDDDVKLLSLAAEITFQLHTEPTFGHLKLQKLIYLCQQLKHMDLAADFKQYAAGPYDRNIATYIDTEFKKRQWFSYHQYETPKYKQLRKCSEHRANFNRFFEKEASGIYDLIGLFRTCKSDHIEIVATLFACWLRLLEKKLSVSEEQLLKDFYAWSEEKNRFSKAEVLNGYKWMKQNSVVPI